MLRINRLLNTAVGDGDLCAWQPVPGVVRVQTRDPKHAKRLAKRKDGRSVVVGVAGGFLRTFEFRHSLPWAVRLMNRYTADEVAANEALERARCPRTKRNPESVVGSSRGGRSAAAARGDEMRTDISIQRGGGER